jgi:hypothetical protein
VADPLLNLVLAAEEAASALGLSAARVQVFTVEEGNDSPSIAMAISSVLRRQQELRRREPPAGGPPGK